MNGAERRTARATVDTVLARENLNPDGEIRDRLARQLATMDAFRACLRTAYPWPVGPAAQASDLQEPDPEAESKAARR